MQVEHHFDFTSEVSTMDVQLPLPLHNEDENGLILDRLYSIECSRVIIAPLDELKANA